MPNPSAAVLWTQLVEMLKLEHRIETSLRRQENVRRYDPGITAQLGAIRGSTLRHIRKLQETAEWSVGPAGEDTDLTCAPPGESVPHELQEDFAAITNAAAGYVMLLTAARVLHDAAVADLAERHLRDYTEGAVRLLGVIPRAVAQSLQEECATVGLDALPSVAHTIAEIWRSQNEPLSAMI
jgi:hypothetical protein